MAGRPLHGRVRQFLARLALIGIASGLLSGIAGPAQAEMRALLVGVSGYAQRPLQGPRNDVRRMRELLEQRAFASAQITTLADGVPGAGEPTRAAIFAALDDLAARSTSGDTVFLYFAGHGSQQPADPTTPQGRAEPDGLHETFLPLDVGRWDGKAGTVRNAIVDFELREKVDRILARGAFVWAVFDSCHAATLVRAAVGDADIRRRLVSPAELGVPADRVDRVRGAAAAPTRPGLVDPGAEAVYFYAAQTTEATIEMKLPPGEAQQEHQGFFSFVLRRALASGRPMSYRQLGQAILAQYGALNQTDATPLFAGNALDRLVLGQASAPVRQWPVSRERMTVPVGTLSGLTEGARFALMPSAAADAGQAIGLLKAVRVGLNQADLEPVGAAGPAAIGPGAQARLLGAPERYTLRVAVDERACREGCRWRAALDALRAQGAPGVDLQWVASSGDLTLHAGEHELLALPPGEPAQPACGARKPRCASPPRGAVLLSAADGDDPVRQARRLAERLHAISRANNLMRLAARAAVPDGPGVEVRVALQPAGAGAAARREASAETVAQGVAGDRLVVSLHNRGKLPADVTVLYLDANHGIELLYPSRAGDVNRLESGALIDIGDAGDITLQNTNGVFGLERVLVIAVEAERRAERMDFSFLAQPPLLAARARDAAMDDDIRAFFEAAFPDARQRDAPPRLPGRRTRIVAFAIDLAAQRAAPAR